MPRNGPGSTTTPSTGNGRSNAPHSQSPSLRSPRFSRTRAQRRHQPCELDRQLDDCHERGLIREQDRDQLKADRRTAEDELRECLATCLERKGRHAEAEEVRELAGDELKQRAFQELHSGNLDANEAQAVINYFGRLTAVETHISNFILQVTQSRATTIQNFQQSRANSLAQTTSDMRQFLDSLSRVYTYKPSDTLDPNRPLIKDRLEEVFKIMSEMALAQALEDRAEDKEDQLELRQEIEQERQLAARLCPSLTGRLSIA